jgi:hypothetical protein
VIMHITSELLQAKPMADNSFMISRPALLMVLSACGGAARTEVVIPRDVPSSVTAPPPTVAATSSSSATPAPTNVDPPDLGTPHDVIEHMIALLEGQRYDKLFQTYVDPEDLHKLLEGKSLREVIDTFVHEDKARDLMRILLVARTMRPVIDAEHHTAEYDIEDKTIHFREVNGRWYIMND